MTLFRSFAYGPAPDEPGDLAEQFHEASKIAPDFAGQALGPAGAQLSTTPGAHLALGRKTLAHTGPRIELPAPHSIPVDLAAVVCNRRSGLPQQPVPVQLHALASVLGLSAGAAADRPELRVTPSAGALYPLDVVVVAHTVEGLPPGSYVYDPLVHALLPRGELDPSAFHAAAGGSGRLAPPQPAATLAIVSTFARTRVKYGLRGYRFALLEAGHLAQATITVASAIGLATLPWGGFADSSVDQLLELDGLERSCLYLVCLSGGAGQS